jgi:tetraacyldisaccharide 4'-kinase
MKTPSFWQTRGALSTLLLPAAGAYGLGAWADRSFTTPGRAPVPVISLGNVTAGGAGKTPATIALAPLLRALGHTPHLLTRGYKAVAGPAAHRVTAGDDWRSVGDEALLLATAAPTWVGRNRVTSAHAAADAQASILICDDALQHHALHKDISLLVLDGSYGIGNGRLLPAGPLRESLKTGLARSHAAILIGEDTHSLSAQIDLPIFRARIEPVGDTSILRGHRWLAFAGIGRPEKFFTTARKAGADIVATRSFADHHAYSESDISQLLNEAKQHGLRLLTTAKDAVKIPGPLRTQIDVLSVRLVFDEPMHLQDFLANRLRACGLS